MGNLSNKRTKSRYKQIFFAVVALIAVIVGAKIIFFSGSEPENEELIYSGEFANEKIFLSQFLRVFLLTCGSSILIYILELHNHSSEEVKEFFSDESLSFPECRSHN